MIKTQHGMLIKISNTACVEIESLARCVQMKTRQLSSKSTLTIRHSNIQRLILLSVSVRQHHTKLAYGLLRKREMGSGFFRVHQFFYQFTSSHAVFTSSPVFTTFTFYQFFITSPVFHHCHLCKDDTFTLFTHFPFLP